MTVTFSSGSTPMCIRVAKMERKRNNVPRIPPIHMSVVLALRHSGGLNAGTPLEIASTPVTAAPPEANALSRRKM